MALGIERGERAARILVERGFARGIGGETEREPLELGQPPHHGVAFGACGCQLVGKVAALIARDERGVAPRGERGGGQFLQALRGEHVGLEPRDVGLGRLRLAGGGARGTIGLGPARIDQPRLGEADLVAEVAVARGGAGLAAERGGARFLVAHDLVEPLEIGLGGAQFLLGILAPRVEPRNARRFLEHQAAFGGLGGDDRADAALAHERGTMRPGGGIGEQQGDVLGTDVAAVETISRTGAALDAAGDFGFARPFLFAVALDQQRDFGEVARRASRGAGEDDVFHAAAAERLGRPLPHHPANRFEQIGLAAAVGADDPRQPRLDREDGGFDEALEPAELQPPEAQGSTPL